MVEIQSEDITPNKDGGVLKELIKPGTGDEKPFIGDNVFVHYTGTLLDGTKFDSSRDRGEKFKFDIGKGNVIKGWDIGIATMKRGEQARFTIRSEYAYGDQGSGEKIPPGTTLVFDVELFDFHGEDISREEDKSLLKRTLKAGEGYSTPNDGARVDISLKGSYQGRVFDERDLEFEIGEGAAKHDIVSGIEEALIKFKKGEISIVSMKSKLAWGTKGCEKFNIPPLADVDYEINLKNFEKAKESWELGGTEKLEQSELLKNKGTELFKVCFFCNLKYFFLINLLIFLLGRKI
jgi:FK506-binding protein 4/5